MSVQLFTRQARFFQHLKINDRSSLTSKTQAAKKENFQPAALAKLEIKGSIENAESDFSCFVLLVKRATQEDKEHWIKRYQIFKQTKLKEKFWLKPTSNFLRQTFWVAIVNDELCLVLEAFLEPTQQP